MIRPYFDYLLLLAVLWGHWIEPCTAEPAKENVPQQVQILDVTAPKDLQVRAAANVPRVDLSWTDNVEGETRFVVERSTDQGRSFTTVSRPPAGSSEYSDTRVEAGAMYGYRIRAEGAGWMTRRTNFIDVRTSDFRVFDGLLHRRKPSLVEFGIERVRIAAGEFFWIWERPGGGYDRTKPNEIGTRRLAREVARSRQVLVINIEHWPVDVRTSSQAEVDDTIAKLTKIISWIRDEAPRVKLGFYSIVPIRDYWTPVNFLNSRERPDDPQWAQKAADFHTAYRQWQAANARLTSLAEQVDYVFPSLYTFSPDSDGWKLYARGNLEEARQYGKPVYPFLWMDYHDSTTLIGQRLPPEFWKLQLHAMREQADGLVMWGGVTYRKMHPRALTQPWRSNEPWWQETKAFVTE